MVHYGQVDESIATAERGNDSWQLILADCIVFVVGQVRCGRCIFYAGSDGYFHPSDANSNANVESKSRDLQIAGYMKQLILSRSSDGT